MQKILLVDDDAVLRMALGNVLSRAGDDVVEAANGNLALEHVRNHGCHLVITDLIMPEKEGLETIIALRRTHPTVKIIALSGGAGADQSLKMAQSLGAARTLNKTFIPRDVLQTVEEVLNAQ